MNDLIYYKKSASIHKSISKQLIEKIIKVGISIKDLTFFIENEIKKKVKYNQSNPMNGGIPFPPMISVNNVIAHQTYKDEKYEINKTEDTKKYVLKKNDLIRFDYGVHVNGYITDSAFTYSCSNKYDDFLNVCKKITQKGIYLVKVDTFISEFGNEMDEYIHSKQFEINGKIYNCKIIKNLNGHNIKRYHTHGGQTLPCIKNNIEGKINNHTVYAVEPFICGLNDYAYSSNHISSYYINYDTENKNLNLNVSDKKLLFDIKKQYKFFDFCARYVYNDLQVHMNQLQNLINLNYIIPESSFIVKKKDVVSHFEHNVYVNEHKNIFLTKNKYY
jgi:methionyl aminopeptidase